MLINEYLLYESAIRVEDGFDEIDKIKYQTILEIIKEEMVYWQTECAKYNDSRFDEDDYI